VALLVEQEFGILLPVRTMGEYLKRWGFTPQRPITRAYEQRPEAVKAWPAGAPNDCSHVP
jgi:transposase